MAHDPVALLNKVTTNTKFISQFNVHLRADANGTEMLILLLYFNSSSIGFTYCYSLEHKLQYN